LYIGLASAKFDVPEEDYGIIEDQIASGDPQDIREAIALLRRLAAESTISLLRPRLSDHQRPMMRG